MVEKNMIVLYFTGDSGDRGLKLTISRSY